ncbi:MAG: leucyl aminopeptidase [Parcubacteria group bacterium]
MRVPQVELISRDALPKDLESLVILVRSEDLKRPGLGLLKILDKQAAKETAQFCRARGFCGSVGDYLYLPLGKRFVVLVGLGSKSKFSLDEMRHAAARSVRLLEKLRIKRAALIWPSGLQGPASESELVAALTEGVILGAYEFDKHKSEAAKKFSSEVVLLSVKKPTTKLRQVLSQALAVSRAVNQARDMQNDNSDDVNPKAIAEYAQMIARAHKLRCSVIKGEELHARGLNMIHAVGRASHWAPRLILLEYRGSPKNKERIALVGKGITFDTGGVNLKPAQGGMLGHMHLDMSGAASVLAIIRLAAALKLKVNLIAVLAIAENAIDGNAYKPGSVIRAFNGTTVEVTNTDAEGRLVLADADAYVAKTYRPSAIINLATLTGTVIIAFGDHFAGLMSNHDELSTQLYAAGVRTGEPLWPLPLVDAYRREIRGTKSDLINTVPTRPPRADATQAMAFLERFCGEVPAALIDIAGASMRGRAHGYLPAGGTGFGVRLLLDYLQHNPRGPRAKRAGTRGLGLLGSVLK